MWGSSNSSRLVSSSWILPLIVAVVAFVVRWESLQHSGGFHAVVGYDEGVYFGASTSFVSGLMPYRDFVLVHPPGSVILLAPFGLLGKVTSDSTGWAAARIFIMLLGALNAALVFVIARRISMVAAVVAGGLYAAWAPVIHVERTTMLEAFVLSALVVALWAVRSPRESTWRLVLAGAFLGLGAATKLWGLVPLAVIVAWLLLARAWRAAGITTAVSGLAFAIVVVPFAAVGPDRMFDLVIRAQLGRGKGGTDQVDRLARMFNVDVSAISNSPRAMTAAGVLALVVVVGAIALAWWKAPTSRLWGALLVVQLMVLLVVPVYFDGYSSFIAPALMLIAGAATACVWNSVDRWPTLSASVLRSALIAGVLVFALASGFRSWHSGHDLTPHLRPIARITDDAQCVGADSAGLLLVTDVLTRNIDRGCETVLDFDGMVYSFDDGANPGKLSSTNRRLGSAEYQQFMRDYMAANDVLLIHRAKTDAMDTVTRQEMRSRPLLYRQKGLRVFGPPDTAGQASAALVAPSATTNAQ